MAPTAANLQPVRLLVVREKENLDKIGKAANIYDAPLAIIVCSDHSKAWTRPFDGKQTVDIDASILTDHMMLEATELGLGSVWVCYFKQDVIKRNLHCRMIWNQSIFWQSDMQMKVRRVRTAMHR